MSERHRASKRLNLISLLLQCVLLAAFCAVVAACWHVYHTLQQDESSTSDSRSTQEASAETNEGLPSNNVEPENSPPDPAPSPGDDSAEADVPKKDESHHPIHGTWQDEYQGKRTMTLRPDGTGTMVVELKGLNATLFASQLTFEMVWSIEGDRLNKRTIGGEPKGKVRAVLAMMGDEVEEEIIELTDERLLVSDGKQQFDWSRVSEPP